jgi:serine/threonine-protein kinase
MKGIEEARWRRLSPWLDELLDLSWPQRAQRLAELAQTDAALAAELQSMLAWQAAIEEQGFLEGAALQCAGEAELSGRRVGAYTIEHALGHGGMGTVWLARRSDGRFQGRAAVKFLNLALLGHGGAQRLQREGSILSQLTHPNIARLLDAGTSDGQSYLILEYVDGRPIDEWCDERRLPVRERIELFLSVLHAVAHAHSKLVLHRDLKPSNILVTADGQVKLLDFGIAKLLHEELAAAPVTALTQAARFLTPDYAAPEQLEGSESTTATDVYALGVLLYQLLVGAHPTARQQHSPLQQLQAIVETPPARPSTAALTIAAALAGQRAATPERLARSLRGDLDKIIGKALKKAPLERYRTVDALAADLRRHLAHEPVSARADTFSYVVGKFVRRHWLPVTAAAIALLALLGAIVGTTWQSIVARQQRAAALAQRDRAQLLLARNDAIFDFVDMMLTEKVPPEHATVIQQMLDRSLTFVDSAAAGQADRKAEILRVLGSYYANLGSEQKAAPLLAQARAMVQERGDPSLQAQLACALATALRVSG